MSKHQDDWIHFFSFCDHKKTMYGYNTEYYCPGCDQFYKQNPRVLFQKWQAETKTSSKR